tara:strand:- start:191 stop:541 length:351 start_codon:yes stop_codon:yes gene_type:complete
MSTTDLFNSNLLKFLYNLQNTLENIKHKKQIIIKLNTLKNLIHINKNVIIVLFKQNILQYKDHILYENMDVLKDLNKLSIFNKIELEDIWNTMDIENQQISWNYLKTFVLLSNNYK